MPIGHGRVDEVMTLDPNATSFGDVQARLYGYETGATLWALRLQVKRDVENGLDHQKLVPYSVVLAYAEQVGQEAVKYLGAKMRRQAEHLFATRVLCALLALVAGVATATAVAL